MNEDLTVLMLREEGTYWESPSIIEATIALKNQAWEGVAHPMEDSMRKIKIVEPITPTKNIVSVSIESVFASVSILVKSVYDSFLVEFVESVKNSFPFNMIFDSAYLLALNVFISKISKETLNNKELKHGYLESIKEET